MVFVLFLGSALPSCSKESPAKVVENVPASTYFTVPVGKLKVPMQLAVTPVEMAQGLMGRKDLVSGKGMLFVYPDVTQMSFYMRNTPMPLDIGYFDRNGVLREVYQMYPFDETPVRSRSKELKFALELPQGDFKALGIKIGDTLDLDVLGGALHQRGFDPRSFALPGGN